MIQLLYGDDDFTISEQVESLKQQVGSDDVRDFNISVLEGSSITLEELVATYSTAPFLAEKRLVVVDHLLSQFEQRASVSAKSPDNPNSLDLEKWDSLGDALSIVPITSDIVFTDGNLSKKNPLFKIIEPHAKVDHCALPSLKSLPQWVTNRATRIGSNIEPRAAQTLAESVGNNLRLISSELEKLAMFRQKDPIRNEDVNDMVSYTRDANVFATIDAIIEGQSTKAIRMAHQVLESGRTAPYLLTMIARQLRLMITAKDLKNQGVSVRELGSKLGLSDYPMRKILLQEKQLTHTQLVQFYRKIVATDLTIKSSSIDQDTVIELLVAELASMPRDGSQVGYAQTHHS